MTGSADGEATDEKEWNSEMVGCLNPQAMQQAMDVVMVRACHSPLVQPAATDYLYVSTPW